MVSRDEGRARDIAYGYTDTYNSTTCKKCGNVYRLVDREIDDSWNAGHYGSTGTRVVWEDHGCPYCSSNGIKSVVKDDGKPSSNRSYPDDDTVNRLMEINNIEPEENFTVYSGEDCVGIFYIDRFHYLRRGSYDRDSKPPGVSKSIMWNILLGRYRIKRIHPSGARNEVIPMKSEDNSMIKFAVVKMKNNRAYTFMHYDTLKLKDGDTVVCDTAQGFEIGIVSAVESSNIPKEQVSKFIIQKVDIAAFNEMKSRYERIKSIQDKMEERRKNIEQMAIYKMMAEQDPEMASLYSQMQEAMGFQPIEEQED